MEKIRQIYIKQKEEVDFLYEELDEFFEKLSEAEKKASHLFFDDMRAMYLKWCQYSEAQAALDIVTDMEFNIEDEE